MDESRIAVLEEKVNNLEAQNKTILEKLEAINANLYKQKGFIGGVVFVASCLVTILSMALNYVVRH